MEQWEKIIKRAREPGKGSWCYVDLPMYAKLTSGRRLLSLSAGIRDWVHPHQYIRVRQARKGISNKYRVVVMKGGETDYPVLGINNPIHKMEEEINAEKG